MRPATPAEIAQRKKNNRDGYKGKGEGTPERKCGGKVKKHQYGGIPYEQIDTMGRNPFVGFKKKGGSLNGIPFYQKGTVKQGIEKQDNIKVNKPIIPYTLVQPQQLPQITIKGIRRANLPGITVVGQNLSKSYPFPYGGINIVSKSINGGLDRKQRVFINPFDKIRN